MKKSKVIISLLLVICIVAVAFFVIKPHFKNNHNISKSDSDLGFVATEIKGLKDISFDSEVVEISVKENIAKIEIISPGLDTYSMRIVIYDIDADKVLSETEFSEGAYITGLTDNGFYVAELSEKSFYLYGNNGEERNKLTFSEAENWSYICAVSENEEYFVYSDMKSNKIFIHDIKSSAVKSLTMDRTYIGTLGFYDSELYCRGAEGEIIRINVENSSVDFAFSDRRLSFVTPLHGIGRTEYNFLSVTEDEVLYIPPYSVDEIIVGIGDDAFTTAVMQEDKTLLRVYDLETNKVKTATVDDTVQSVNHLSDGRLLVHTGNSMEKKHNIYLYDMTNCSKSSLNPSTEDKPKSSRPGKTSPEAEVTENAVIVEKVPIIAQFPEFPTGCESVSAVMAMRFAGEEITVTEFVDRFLPKSTHFYYENGINYGPSPYEYFIGNPKTAASYGCMAPVIENALCDYFGNSNRVLNTTGTELGGLCSNYIDNGIPVIMWATINMLETNPKNSWHLSDGKRFTWPGNEHCMLLIGYDSDYYYFNDPYAGSMVKYKKSLTEDRYAELGFQSVVILNE